MIFQLFATLVLAAPAASTPTHAAAKTSPISSSNKQNSQSNASSVKNNANKNATNNGNNKPANTTNRAAPKAAPLTAITPAISKPDTNFPFEFTLDVSSTLLTKMQQGLTYMTGQTKSDNSSTFVRQSFTTIVDPSINLGNFSYIKDGQTQQGVWLKFNSNCNILTQLSVLVLDMKANKMCVGKNSTYEDDPVGLTAIDLRSCNTSNVDSQYFTYSMNKTVNLSQCNISQASQ